MDKVAAVLPTLKPYVEGYKSTVAEAESIWNSGGMTADDIKAIQREAAFWKTQIDAAIVKYRELQKPA